MAEPAPAVQAMPPTTANANDTPPAHVPATSHNPVEPEEHNVAATAASSDDHSSANEKDVAHGNTLTRTRTADLPLNQQPIARRAIIMLALCLAVFLAALDITIVATAAETIVNDLKSPSGYTWIGSGFTLASAASTPIWGKVSDIFGRRPLLLLANAVFFVGSLICGLSVSMPMLIAARVIQGIGAGGLLVLVNICISDLVELRVRSVYYAMIGAVWAFASSIGPMVGGAFTEKVSWRWCFYVNLPVDGLAFTILLFFLKIKTPKTPVWAGLKAIDWLGSLTLVGGTLMLLLGLEYGGIAHPWDSAIVLCLIIFGIFTFVIYFLIEWKVAEYPIMPLDIFSRRSNAAALLAVFLHGMVFIASSYYLPLFFQVGLGATPILSGVYLLPFSVALAVGAMASGIIIKKTGKFRELILVCFALLTLSYGLYCNLYRDSGWAKIIIYQILAGLGVGPLFQAPLIALQAHTAGRDISTATMTLAFVRNLAVTVGIVIANVVWQNEFKKKTAALQALVGDSVTSQLAGNRIAAQSALIKSLPAAQRHTVQTYFAESLHPMWIMFTAFAALGLLVSFLIKSKSLNKEHTVVEQGIEAEKAKRVERKQEQRDRADKKKQKLEAKHGIHGSVVVEADDGSRLEKGVAGNHTVES